MNEKVLSVNNLVINFKTDNGLVQAVRDVSFDLYRGENLGEGFKSIAFRLTFEDYNKTLETKDVDNQIDNILKKLAKDFDAKLR